MYLWLALMFSRWKLVVFCDFDSCKHIFVCWCLQELLLKPEVHVKGYMCISTLLTCWLYLSSCMYITGIFHPHWENHPTLQWSEEHGKVFKKAKLFSTLQHNNTPMQHLHAVLTSFVVLNSNQVAKIPISSYKPAHKRKVLYLYKKTKHLMIMYSFTTTAISTVNQKTHTQKVFTRNKDSNRVRKR